MDICLDKSFLCLGDEYLTDINGGTVWGVVSGVFEVVAGAAGVVGGAALLGIPEPTGTTKFAGGTAIVSGVAGVASGVATIASNLK